jgi:hypothetical protein
MTMLFIIGTGRCGSTMVQEVLARHPDVGFISNLDARFPALNAKGRWNNALYQRTPLRYTQRDRGRISGRVTAGESHFGPSEAFRILERRVSPIWSAPCRDLISDDVTPWLERRFRSFFGERMTAQNKLVFMHKFTGWPRAGFLHKIFPEARFLHVIRDGRAVAGSVVERLWWRGYGGPWIWGRGPLPDDYAKEWEASGRDFVVLAGLEWKLLMDAFVAAKRSVPAPLWMEVRYEDFVDAPRARLKDIFAFVGLDWSDEFDGKFAQFAFTNAMKDRFRKDLTQAQVAMLEEVLRAHLIKFGYEEPAAAGEQGSERGLR